jgi:hypothetical protein
MRALWVGTCAWVSIGAPLAHAADPVPQNLMPPAGLVRMAELNADGVQIYRCARPKDGAADAAAVWGLEAPRAALTETGGQPAGKHYAGPTWEAVDGSRITGKVVARAVSPDPTAIVWLLLKTESAGVPGRFDRVSAVQRLYTAGGSAPSGPCASAGEVLEVPYRAVYVFWGQPR